MTLDAVFAELKSRGLTVYLKDGEPRIKGPAEEITQRLVAVLKRRRNEIIVRLGGTPPPEPVVARAPAPPLPREWLDADGTRNEEFVRGDDSYHPDGFLWYRCKGERCWRVVPAHMPRALKIALPPGQFLAPIYDSVYAEMEEEPQPAEEAPPVCPQLYALENGEPPPPALREWLWVDGHRCTEESPGDPQYHPGGAWWWRFQGERGWCAIPSRVQYSSGQSMPLGEILRR